MGKAKFERTKPHVNIGTIGHVVINMMPGEPGTGFVFEDKVVGGVIPREFIKPASEGMREAMDNGVLAGYPMVDVKVQLVFGSYHDVDSSEIAFKIAGSMAFKEAARKATPVLLEPLMAVEVLTPEEYMGDVIGDLRSKTQGRANYSMEFDSYAEVPKSVSEEIIKKTRGE